MIEEEVVVVAVADQRAWVEKVPGGGCQGCSNSSGCSTSLLDRYIRRRRLEVAPGVVDVRKGDHVIVGIDEHALLYASVLIYTLPLVTLLTGSLCGQWLASRFDFQSPELLSIISGLFGFLACLAYIKHSPDRSMTRRMKPVVLRKP